MKPSRRLHNRRCRQATRSNFRRLPIALAIISTMPTPVWAAANVILPDGRTQTHLDQQGNTTDIRTSTVVDGTGLNSFSRFEVARGQLVNVHVPDQASRLINLVHERAIRVEGVLNAYKAGHIGGDVWFASPFGMVVGVSGVINAGHLTVITPDKAFMDRLISTDGAVDTAVLSSLEKGQVPISPDGRVLIEGQINAPEGIAISAAQTIVAVTGTLRAGEVARLQQQVFEATVNTEGLEQASDVAVADNGDIVLFGSEQAEVDGTVTASGSHGGAISINGGQVQLTASAAVHADGNEGGGSVQVGGVPQAADTRPMADVVEVASGARLTADATRKGRGGRVTVWSQRSTHFAGHVSARGGETGGDGGFVEISARSGLLFEGRADLSAALGSSGILLLDPDELHVVSAIPDSSDEANTSGTDPATLGDFTSGGSNKTTSYVTVATLQDLGDAHIILQAYDKLVIDDNVSVDLSSSLKSKSLTLQAGAGGLLQQSGAGDIEFKAGASITTGGGAVILQAGRGFEEARATTGNITLGSITTKGGEIKVEALGDITLPSGATLDSKGTDGGGRIYLSAMQTALNNTDILNPKSVFNTVSPIRLDGGDIRAQNTISLEGAIDAGQGDVVIEALTGSQATFAANPVLRALGTKLMNKFGKTLSSYFEAAWFDSTASAEISVTGSITGGDVSLNSLAIPEVKLVSSLVERLTADAVEASYNQNGVIFVGHVGGGAQLHIQSGADIKATRLHATAQSSPTLNLLAESVNQQSGGSVTVAWGTVDVKAQLTLDDGATITAQQAGLNAINRGAYRVKALSKSLINDDSSTGNAGVVLAFTNINTLAEAELAGTVKLENIDSSTPGALTLNAVTDNPLNATVAATTVGKVDPSDQNKLRQLATQANDLVVNLAKSAVAAVQEKLGHQAQQGSAGNASDPGGDDPNQGGKHVPSLASALAFGFGNQRSIAHVAGTAQVLQANNGDSEGRMLVNAFLNDRNTHLAALSQVNSGLKEQDNAPSQAVSMAVTFGDQKRMAEAGVDPYVSPADASSALRLAQMTINSQVKVPLSLAAPVNQAQLWLQHIWDALSDSDTTLSEAINELSSAWHAALSKLDELENQDWSVDQSAYLDATFTAQEKLDLLRDKIHEVINELINGQQSGQDPRTNDLIREGEILMQALTVGFRPLIFSDYAGASANGQADTTANALAGAVSYTRERNRAQSWLARELDLTGTGSSGFSDISGGSGAFAQKLEVDGTAPLALSALQEHYRLFGAGNGLSPAGGVGGASRAVGGVVSWKDLENRTRAWVAKGTSVTGASGSPNMSILARDSVRALNFASSGGHGKGLTGNGSAAVNRFKLETQAAVDSEARIDQLGDITIQAAGNLNALAVSGAFARSQQTGVGLGFAWNQLDGSTRAGIFDTTFMSDDLDHTAMQSLTALSDAGVQAQALSVQANQQQFAVALAAAGAESKGDSDTSSGLTDELKTGANSSKQEHQGDGSDTDDVVSQADASARNNSNTLAAQNQQSGSQAEASQMAKGTAGQAAAAQSATASGEGASSAPAKPSVSITAAGSVALNVEAIESSAELAGAAITLSGHTGADISAVNSSFDLALAGAAALNRASAGSGEGKSVALGGTVGMNILACQAIARAVDSVVILTRDNAPVTLDAVNGGQAVAIGIGLASGGSTATIAGSGSVVVSNNETRAALENSSVEYQAQPLSAGVLSVRAQDSTDVGVGGGALSNSQKGVGMAVSVALSHSRTQAEVLGSEIVDVGSLHVQAFTPQKSGVAALVGTLGSADASSVGLSGATAINWNDSVTEARVDKDAAGRDGSVIVNGDVDVTASSQHNAQLAARLNLTHSLAYDFDGIGVNSGANTSLGGGVVEDTSSEQVSSGIGSLSDVATAVTVAGSGTASTGSSSDRSFGLSVAYNRQHQQYRATLAHATVQAANVTLSGHQAVRVVTLAAGTAIGGNSSSLKGSGSAAVTDMRDSMVLAGSGDQDDMTSGTVLKLAQEGSLALSATRGDEVWTAAGQLSQGGAGAGATIAVTLAGQQTRALMSRTHLKIVDTSISDITLEARDQTHFGTASSALSFAQNAGFGGSLALLIAESAVEATSEHNTLAFNSLSVSANDDISLWTGAGALSGASGGTGAAGIGVAVTISERDVTAASRYDAWKSEDDDQRASNRHVEISADQQGFVASGAVGGAAASGTLAGGGSVVVNALRDRVKAELQHATLQADSVSLASLKLSAHSNSDLYSLSGAFAGARQGAAGGGVGVNLLGRYVSVVSQDNQLDIHGDVLLEAVQSTKVDTLSAALAGAGSIAFGGAAATTLIEGDTAATTQDDQWRDEAGLTVSARNEQQVRTLAIGLAGGASSGAAGVGVAITQVDDHVSAWMQGGQLGWVGTDASNQPAPHFAKRLHVDARSDRTLQTLSIGGAASGGPTGAGAMILNLIDGQTDAHVSDGSQVLVVQDAGVTALTRNQLEGVTGELAVSGSVGVGLSSVTNQVGTRTVARVGGENDPTAVTALGLDSPTGDALSSGLRIADGSLQAPSSVSEDITRANYALPDYQLATRTLHGIAVNAQSINLMSALSAGGSGAGTAALNANVAVNVLNGETRATARNALLSSLHDIDINAGGHDFAGAIAVSAAGASQGAGAAAVGVNVFDGDVEAGMRTPQPTETGQLTVSSQQLSVSSRADRAAVGLSAGAAGAGGLGFAGSALTTRFAGDTLAWLSGEGGQVDQAMSLKAETENSAFLSGGSLGVGSMGAGLSTVVLQDETNTQTRMGSGSQATDFHVGRADILAKQAQNYIFVSATGAMTAGGAFAGNVVTTLLDNTVRADLLNVALSSDADIQVDADNQETLKSIAGALAGSGGMGVGASANVLKANGVVATTATNSALDAEGDIDLQASRKRNFDLWTVTGGVGLTRGGIGGTLGLVLLGSGEAGQAMDQYDHDSSGTLSRQDETTNADVTNNSGLEGDRRDQVRDATRVRLKDDFARVAQDAVSTQVTGGHLDSQHGNLMVKALAETGVRNIAGAVGIGGPVGIGAGVVVNRHDDTVQSQVDGSLLAAPLGSLNIQAESKTLQGADFTADSRAYAGGGALGLGLSAAVVDALLSTHVTAYGDLNAGSGAQQLNMTAADSQSMRGEGVSVAAGAAALGGMAVNVDKESQVRTELGGKAAFQQGGKIRAEEQGALSAKVTGASGGVVSGNAAVALTKLGGQVSAGLLDTAHIETNSRALDIEASGGSEDRLLKADALGINVGVLSVGASVAKTTNEQHVRVWAGNNVVLDGLGTVNMTADGAGRHEAYGRAGAGGYVTANATEVKALDRMQVTAESGEGLRLNEGDFSLSAKHKGWTHAEATGGVAGALAVGVVQTEANSTASTVATLGQIASSAQRQGALSVKAESDDVFFSKSISGAGALYAGNAATSRIYQDTVTRARLKETDDTVHAGALTLSATHTSRIDKSKADATNVGFIGGGAALVDNDLTSTVSTEFGEDGRSVSVQADQAAIRSQNRFSMLADGRNANGRSGGALNVNVIQARTDISLNTDTWLRGTLDVLGDPLQPDRHNLSAGAFNDFGDSWMQAKVSTGGAVQGLSAQAMLYGRGHARVHVPEYARLNAAGDVTLYAGSAGQLKTDAYAHTWGAAGVVNSQAESSLTVEQTISLDGDVLSSNNIWVGAGYDQSLGGRLLKVGANGEAYNYTALAVGTHPDARATLTNTNTVNISGGVLAGRDALIQAGVGDHHSHARAYGKNSYQEVAEKIANFFISAINWIAGKTVLVPVTLSFNGGSASDHSSSSINLTPNTIIESGLSGKQWLTLTNDANGGIQLESSPLLRYDLDEAWDYKAALEARQNELGSRITELDGDDSLTNTEKSNLKARYQDELTSVNYQLDQLDGRDGVVPLLTLDDVLIQAGDVKLVGGAVNRNGAVLNAHGVEGLTLDNQSTAFLKIEDITVKAGGGQVYINGRHQAGVEGVTAPHVKIASTATPQDSSIENPDIFLMGDIYNPEGDVSVNTSQGSIHQQGSINATNVTLSAPGGAYFQGYQDGFHNSGNTDPITDRAGILAGGAVFISAEYLNVNGDIQSGYDTLQLDLSGVDGELADLLRMYHANRDGEHVEQFIQDLNDYNNSHGTHFALDTSTGWVRLTPAADYDNPNQIAAFWDPEQGAVVVPKVENRPGLVSLFGNLFNTSAEASIKAATGLAQLSVVSDIKLPMIVKGLNAGSAREGGVVRFTDLSRRLGSDPMVTEYRYVPADGKTHVYTFGAGQDASQGNQSELSGTQVFYQVAPDRWLMQYASTKKTSATEVIETTTTKYFGGSVISSSTTVESSQTLPGSNEQNFYTALRKGAAQTSYERTWTVTGQSNTQTLSSTTTHSGFLSLIKTVTEKKKTITPVTDYTATLDVQTASYPVAIQFIGQPQGAINVTTAGSLWLDGVISNPSGTVRLSVGSGQIGVMNSQARLRARDIDLQSAGGIGQGTEIWSSAKGLALPQNSLPLTVQLTESQGGLTAISRTGDIRLGASGNLYVAQVSAAGDVSLSATGDIAAQAINMAAEVSGHDLDLTAAGHIGAMDRPLDIQALGVLQGAAGGGIHFNQTQGDLYIDQLTAGGNVSLSVPAGALRSAKEQTLDQRTIESLREKWDQLGLTGAAATHAAEEDYAKARQGYLHAHQQYWQLKPFVAVDSSDTPVGLTAAGIDHYRTAAEVFYGTSAVTDAQVEDYVRQTQVMDMYRHYHDALQALNTQYGVPAQHLWDTEDVTAFGQLLDDHLQPTLTQNVAWTEAQLLSRVSQQRVLEDTVIAYQQAPNIIAGGSVSLSAASSVGNDAAPYHFSSDADGTVTIDPELAAVLAAAAPGDIHLQTSGGRLEGQVDQFHAFYLQGGTRVDAAAGRDILLTTSSGDLDIGTIISGSTGRIRLSSRGDMQQQSGQGIVGGNDGVVLIAEGDMGAEDQPLNLSLTGPLLQLAADGDVWLQQQGDLVLGNLYSGGRASLSLQGAHAALNSYFDRALVPHISAEGLRLQLAGNAGAGVPLAVSLGGAGLSGVIGGLLNVVSPEDALALNQLSAGDLHAITHTAGMEGRMALMGVSVSNDAELQAMDTLTGVTPSGVDLIVGGTMTLQALKIGEPERPLRTAAPHASLIEGFQGVWLHNSGPLDVSSLRSGGDVGLVADTIRAGNVFVGGHVTLEADRGSMWVDTLEARTGHLLALNDITLRQALIADALILQANDMISGRVRQQDVGSGFDLTATGYDRRSSAQLNLQLNVQQDIRFERLQLGTGEIHTNATEYAIRHGWVDQALSLHSGQAYVYMNNLNLSSRQADVQLAQPRAAFWLQQEGRHTHTNAYIVHFDPLYTVSVPNYSIGRQDSSMVTQYVSADLTANQMNSEMVNGNFIKGPWSLSQPTPFQVNRLSVKWQWPEDLGDVVNMTPAPSQPEGGDDAI